MTILEIRILNRILPKSVNELDRLMPNNSFISHTRNSSADNNNTGLYQTIKNHQKAIRDQKRQLLDQYLEEYESTIEQYESLYQVELMNFLELQAYEDDNQSKDRMECLENYLNVQTMNKIRQIRYNGTIVRYKLLHPRHQSLSSKMNHTISIYPEVINEIFEQVFTQKELDFLSSTDTNYYFFLGMSYIYICFLLFI